MQQHPKILLVGNPNCGKTSLFNEITGLFQKVGNFAGVTVEKKSGFFKLNDGSQAELIDLPGTYSLYPKSGDEVVSYQTILNRDPNAKPDLILIIADATNLKRNLLFATQIMDLGIPTILCISMLDIAAKKEISIDLSALSIQLGIPVVGVNPRRGKGIQELIKQISISLKAGSSSARSVIEPKNLAPELIQELQMYFPEYSPYALIHLAAETNHFHHLSDSEKEKVREITIAKDFKKNKIQAQEVLQRYGAIHKIMNMSVVEADPLQKELRSERIDKLLLHPLYGNILLLVVLFLIFQAIFWLASFPMDFIDTQFNNCVQWLGTVLPDTWWASLIGGGILPGIGGVVVFIPQIVILFALISLLEDSGYMARISFLTDRLMRSAGLSGRSVMPLISGMACAVPAIMSTRTIENLRERFITILITPLMSCSARLPIYTILITLVIPRRYYLGFISLQGLVMLGLYLLGFFAALAVAKISSYILKGKSGSFFFIELPVYKSPRLKNTLRTVWDKTKIFVLDAGKVILIISLIIWFLSNTGPGQYSLKRDQPIALESSFMGKMGKGIQPIFEPLGYDWKISIGLLTSFAAREVFVGTMATLYSVDENNDGPLLKKMQTATREDGQLIYSFATGISLLLFYVFAMQCMSTMTIVYKETKRWQMPVIQFIFMFVLAYGTAFLAYILLK